MLSVKWIQFTLVLSFFLIACRDQEINDSSNKDAINSSPVAVIAQPINGSVHPEDGNISFIGTGSDKQDGILDGTRLEWSSNTDGQLDIGETISTALSAGSHTITLKVADTDGATHTDTITISVNAAPIISSIEANPGNADTGSPITFKWKIDDAENDALTCSLDIDEDGSDEYIINDCNNSSAPTHTYMQAGNYQVRLTIADDVNPPVQQSINIIVTEPPNNSPQIHLFTVTPNNSTINNSVTFEWNISDADSDTLICKLDIDGNGAKDYHINNCTSDSSQTHLYTQAQTYQTYLTIEDATNTPVQQSVSVMVVDEPSTTTVYPSTATAWVIPGYHADIYDPLDYAISGKEQLIDWELTHADIAFGSNYTKSVANKIKSIGYMYTQKIDFSPNTVGASLRAHAKNIGDNYEDYFLHFAEDTIVEIKAQNANQSKYTPFNRHPWVAGWTGEEGHSGFLIWQRPPYALSPWKSSDKGGCVYIYMPEKFDQVYIDLTTVATTGRLEVQYPSAINANTGVASQWRTIDSNITDATNGLKMSGSIKWLPPHDWQRAATYDPATNTGTFFGNSYLKQGEKTYVIKLCRADEDLADQPVVQNIQIKDFMPYLNASNHQRVIYGWDARNDKNADGYIDETEFAERINVNASAKFRYESRVTPLGNMWSESSNFQRPDFLNPAYRTAIAKIISQEWLEKGLVGAYNDDVFRLDNIDIISGGKTIEHGVPVNDATFRKQYQDAFIETINTIKQTSGSQWVAANISAENLFVRQNRKMQYINAFSTYLREDYIRPGIGLNGYFGISKMWDMFALTEKNKTVQVIAHTGKYGNIPFSNTQDAWEKYITTGLAIYYLINVPGKTAYTSWNSSYNYGSGNTLEGNFYTAGVPKNIAYQPSSMLAVDLGEPTGNIQTWPDQLVAPLVYTTKATDDDYAVIGDSTQSVLYHPDIATTEKVGSVIVTPSNMYYAWQSAETLSLSGVTHPKQMIIARDYTNGLVLYHLDFFGGDADFNTVSQDIELPHDYHRVNYDGSLQAASNKISLTGYQGVILIKAGID